MTFPKRLFIEITSECNLKCHLCKLWQQVDSENQLRLEEKLNFLKEIIYWMKISNKKIEDKISFVLTGGEPFL